MFKNIKTLAIAASLSGLAALCHLGCIVFGGPWYRFFGAGEQMAQMADAGMIEPTITTSIIVLTLTIWSMYALSGAGVLFRLPLLRLGLIVISGIYLTRGVAFIFIMDMFPGNSLNFWLISSAICLFIGAMYAWGVKQNWAYISKRVK